MSRPNGARNKNGVARILTVQGYIDVFQPNHPMAKKNGYVREHRMIAWDAGLLRDPKKSVHHKNGIKTDNRVENLEVVDHGEHTGNHWKGVKREPWTSARRKDVSVRMAGNKNWAGKRNVHENPEKLLGGYR